MQWVSFISQKFCHVPFTCCPSSFSFVCEVSITHTMWLKNGALPRFVLLWLVELRFHPEFDPKAQTCWVWFPVLSWNLCLLVEWYSKHFLIVQQLRFLICTVSQEKCRWKTMVICKVLSKGKLVVLSAFGEIALTGTRTKYYYLYFGKESLIENDL